MNIPDKKEFVNQAIQNLVFFSALIFSRGFMSVAVIAVTVLGYVLLCLMSFFIIILVHNIKPVDSRSSDREKGSRFLISFCAAGILLLLGGIYTRGMFLFLMVLMYAVVAFCHALFVRDMVIIDVLGTGIEFSLKASLGAAIISTLISPWLIICTFLLALLVSIGKRRNEIYSMDRTYEQSRKVLTHYTPRLLDQMISVVTSSTILAYALFTISTHPLKYIHSMTLIYTIPFVIYGIMRFVYIVYTKEMKHSIEVELLLDKPMVLNFFIWICVVTVIITFLSNGT